MHTLGFFGGDYIQPNVIYYGQTLANVSKLSIILSQSFVSNHLKNVNSWISFEQP